MEMDAFYVVMTAALLTCLDVNLLKKSSRVRLDQEQSR